MRRSLFSLPLLGLALAVPTAALATLPPAQAKLVTGSLAAASPYSFIVQTPGRATGVLAALTSAADRISSAEYPYVWGGGHAQAGIASLGGKGPGYNGRRRGYDCSGSVAAVLAGAGLWPVDAGVPNDAGVIAYLRQRGEIAPGAGAGVGAVTLYDEPGVHIFMNINGRFFGTSDGGAGGNPRGGPGWLDDGAWDAGSAHYRRYHFLPSVLRATTDAGLMLAFEYGGGVSLPADLPPGAAVRVAYRTTDQGTMVAEALSLVGELSVTGTLTAYAEDGSSFTIHRTSGPTITLPATPPLIHALLYGQLAVGDTVAVSYITRPVPTVLSLTITGVPTQTTTTTSPTPTTTTPTTTTPTTTTTTTPTTTTSTTPTPGAPGNGANGGGG